MPSKSIAVDLRPNSCLVMANKKIVKKGSLYREVLPDDCNWQIEGSGDNRHIWLTLAKKNITKANQHWKCVFEGDPCIDLSDFSPPVHAIDPSTMDKEAIRRQMQQVIALF